MKFLTLISFVLILAKIFNLITLSWIMCFIPFIIAIGYCLNKEDK